MQDFVLLARRKAAALCKFKKLLAQTKKLILKSLEVGKNTS